MKQRDEIDTDFNYNYFVHWMFQSDTTDYVFVYKDIYYTMKANVKTNTMTILLFDLSTIVIDFKKVIILPCSLVVNAQHYSHCVVYIL